MKKGIMLLVLGLLPLMMAGQSVTKLRSLDIQPNSQADVQYNNLFGEYKNDELDEPFPYVVIEMNLSGGESAVKMAKDRISLDVGTMLPVISTVKTLPNKIVFLIPKGVRNIYILCGDGCEKKELYSGTLIGNKVYTCTVEYQSAAQQGGDNQDAVLAQMEAMQKQNEQMQRQMEAMQKQNEQMQQLLQNRLSSPTEAKPSAVAEAQTLPPLQTSPQMQSEDNILSEVEETKPNSDRLTKEGGIYYLDGKELSKREMDYLFQYNCPNEYSLYTKAKAVDVTSEVFISIGGVSCIVGLVLVIFDNETIKKIGLGTMIGGLVTCMGIGLPLKFCNKSSQRWDNCMRAYNNKFRTAQNDKGVTLNMQVSQDGFGVALRF